jgi:NAD(P)-dependent dehydrogenase (short-subunit alcohol dehydrogenase family)
MLTQCLAIEWAPYGVRAITISPGFTAVGMSAEGIASGGNSSSAIIDHTPQARLIAAEEIADLVYLGASERMRSVTGSELLADGGFVAGSGL